MSLRGRTCSLPEAISYLIEDCFVAKNAPRNDEYLKRDLPDLFKVDIEQLFRFCLGFGLIHIPRADSTLTVRSIGAEQAFRAVISERVG